jgi:iron-sulfur cluster repair protein YtfE (RIC family)
MKSFNDLLEIHKWLDDLFLSHQRALLQKNLERASLLLEAYETELLAHLNDLEELLLPLFGQRVQDMAIHTLEMFFKEHDTLRHYLRLFKDQLETMVKMEDLERGVLVLLDSQYLFKRLLVQHDTRERKILYPQLNTVTTDLERETLFSRLDASPVATSH